MADHNPRNYAAELARCEEALGLERRRVDKAEAERDQARKELFAKVGEAVVGARKQALLEVVETFVRRGRGELHQIQWEQAANVCRQLAEKGTGSDAA